MKLGNLKFQIKHTTGNMLTANQQRPYQHCPQVKSDLSGSSSSPGYSQLMAEPSNSGGIHLQKFFKVQRSKVTFWPRPASTWVNLVDPSLNSLDLRNGGVALYLENFNRLKLLGSVP